jgi:hypothetical protein
MASKEKHLKDGTNPDHAPWRDPRPDYEKEIYKVPESLFPDHPLNVAQKNKGKKVDTPAAPGVKSVNEAGVPIITDSDDTKRANATKLLDKFVKSKEFKSLNLVGGSIPDNTDWDAVRTGDLKTLETISEGLEKRFKGRAEGYQGEWGDGGYAKFSNNPYGDVDPTSGKITTQGEMRDMSESPVLKEGTEFKPILQEVKAEEILDPREYNVDPTATAAPTATVDTISQAQNAQAQAAQSYNAQLAAQQVQAQAIQAAQLAGVSDTVQAQQEQVATLSTVQGQLAQLSEQFSGGQVPAFAAGAIRVAEQRLAARGMGASSMAAESLVQASMEAMTPIAAADANTYAKFQELNLNNRQQAEVLNSQMALQVDLQNLSNEQQTRVFNGQNAVQSLFTDQAAVNSSSQFNAQSAQQNDQFYSNLFNQTSQFNASQSNTVKQFNAGQTNAQAQFNSTLQNQREQFNKKNQLLIDQSNVVWRRQVNQANTAIQNAANQVNTQNRYNLSTTALNNMWQQFRDDEFWARTTARDDEEYNKKVAYASFTLNKSADAAFVDNLSGAAFDLVADVGSQFKDEIADLFTSDDNTVDGIFTSSGPGLLTGGVDFDGGLFT